MGIKSRQEECYPLHHCLSDLTDYSLKCPNKCLFFIPFEFYSQLQQLWTRRNFIHFLCLMLLLLPLRLLLPLLLILILCQKPENAQRGLKRFGAEKFLVNAFTGPVVYVINLFRGESKFLPTPRLNFLKSGLKLIRCQQNVLKNLKYLRRIKSKRSLSSGDLGGWALLDSCWGLRFKSRPFLLLSTKHLALPRAKWMEY